MRRRRLIPLAALPLIALPLAAFPLASAAPGPPPETPLSRLAAELATIGGIAEPAATARAVWDAVGANLRHAPDFFGRSDAAAGEVRYEIDERSPLARRGLEAGLVIGPGAATPLGRVRAELDIGDWGLVSSLPWTRAAAALREAYPVIGDPAARRSLSVELPARAGARVVLTIARRGAGGERIWSVHVAEYEAASPPR